MSQLILMTYYWVGINVLKQVTLNSEGIKKIWEHFINLAAPNITV